MVRVLLTAAAASLVLATGAFAEPAAAPDPQRLQLARDLMAATGGVQAYEQRMRAQFAGLTTAMKAALPNETAATAQLRESVFNYFADEQVKALPALLDAMAEVYAEHLSESELRALLVWSQSEAARSIREKMPAISQELIVRQVPLMMKLFEGVGKKAVDRTCAENGCTSEQRQALTTLIEQAKPSS